MPRARLIPSHAAVLTAGLLLTSALAHAQGPQSTGLGTAGGLDPNYQVSVNGGAFAQAFIRNANYGSTPLVAPTASGTLPGGSADGNLTRFSYSFRTTFVGGGLTGFSFQCGVDDTFSSITLNGALVSGATCAQYGLGATNAVTGGLLAGTNTLVFNTTGNGVTDGLAVQVTGVAGSVVPEPGTWALLGTGLIALGGAARRRRTRVA